MNEMIAPCGINCTQCDAYIATINNDTALHQKLAEDYLKHFGKEIDPNDLNCDGCPADGRHIGFCAQCEIRSCTVGKGFATCAECDEFPCTKGSFIWTPESKSKATLEALRH